MNYADLFRVTLPETALELAALIVLIVDLGFLRKAALKLRVAVAALLGVAGCGAAIWALGAYAGAGFSFDGTLILAQGGIEMSLAIPNSPRSDRRGGVINGARHHQRFLRESEFFGS